MSGAATTTARKKKSGCFVVCVRVRARVRLPCLNGPCSNMTRDEEDRRVMGVRGTRDVALRVCDAALAARALSLLRGSLVLLALTSEKATVAISSRW